LDLYLQNIDLHDLAERHATRHVQALLGPPTFLGGEDIAAYYGLHERVHQEIRPQDFMEEVWTRDVVDLMYQALRWSRLRDELLKASSSRGLSIVLREMMDAPYAEMYTKGWLKGDPEHTKIVDDHLQRSRLGGVALTAHALAVQLQAINAIDMMAMRCEQRRDGAFRSIERHREGFGKRLREVSAKIINEVRDEDDEEDTQSS
jgi:hypothetical protein